MEKKRFSKFVSIAICIVWLWFWSGYQFTWHLLTGDFRTITNEYAGFQIEISPYWRLYEGDESGIRVAKRMRLLVDANLPFLTSQPSLSIDHTPNEKPSLEHALDFFSSGMTYRYYKSLETEVFERHNLNGREAFVHSYTKNGRNIMIIVVLGMENEYILHVTAKHPSEYKAILETMINSFQVLDGY